MATEVRTPFPEASFPQEIWDGTTQNRSRLDDKKNVNGIDWWRLISEMEATQTLLTQVAALGNANWQEYVLSRFDPSSGLPVGPSDEDRYLSTATANGWNDKSIYEWNGSAWDETVPIEGMTVWVDDENKIWVYQDGTWIKLAATISHGGLLNLTSTDDHTQYMHKDVARTVTAKHTFAPTSAQAPFDLGINAQGQLVTGLNADQLDGQHASDFEASGTMTTHLATYDHTNIHPKDQDDYLDFGGANQVSAADLATHIASTSNPHGVTKAQVGLSNVVDALQLQAANNLNDVADAPTARANIGAYGGAALTTGRLVYATGAYTLAQTDVVSWDGTKMTFGTNKYLDLPSGVSQESIRFGNDVNYSIGRNGSTVNYRFGGSGTNILYMIQDNQLGLLLGGNTAFTAYAVAKRFEIGTTFFLDLANGGTLAAPGLRIQNTPGLGLYGDSATPRVGLSVISGRNDIRLSRNQLQISIERFADDYGLPVFKIDAVSGNYYVTQLLNGNILQIGNASGIIPAQGMIRYTGNFEGYDGTGWVKFDDVEPGAITNSKLADMAQATIKGRAAATGTGSPVDLTATQVWDILGISDADAVQAEPMGFEDPKTDITLSWSDASPDRTLTLTPTGASFDVWVKGLKYTKSSADSVQITDTEGLWFIYYKTVGVLEASQTPWDLSQHAPVALVYWDAVNDTAIITGYEMHGLTMDWATHLRLHEQGTVYVSGLTLTGTTTGDGSADADAQVAVADGAIRDEDLEINPHDGAGSGLFEQELSAIAQIPVYYRSGSGGLWRKVTANNFPVKQGTARIQYNLDTAGTWTTPDVTANLRYMAMWIFATNDINEPIIAVLGQREDLTLTDAQDNNQFESLDLGSFPTKEAKILYRLIFQTSSVYANTPSARLREIVDLRTDFQQSVGNFTATSHSGLADRDVTNSHPSTAISVDTANLDGLLSGADDDVQAALETLDESFGAHYEAAASDAESTTTSTTLQEKLTHTTPSLPAGTYRVGWSMELTNSDSEKECAFRVRVAATTEAQGEVTEKNGDDYQAQAGFKHYVLASPGTIASDIYWAATGNGGTAKIRRARLEIWRVA